MHEIVVLGDSLSVAPARAQSFPAELQKRIDRKKLSWHVVNAGQWGGTTADGVRRLDDVLGTNVQAIVIALGANDALRGVDLGIVERNLRTILDAAKARGMRVLLCGMETPPSYGWRYTLGFHNLFPRLAREYEVPLVPFLLEDVALISAMNGPDGIHPNAAGAKRIAETVWPHLEPLLR